MKTIKLITLVLFSTLLFGLFLNSCTSISDFENKDNNSENSELIINGDRQKSIIVDECGTAYTTELYAGQHILVGSIIVKNTNDSVYITYNTTNGWVIGETHLFAGDYEDIPLTSNGNPKIGRFPLKNTFNPKVTSYTYALDIESLSDCFSISAHAVVYLYDQNGGLIQTETAWGNGTQFNQSGSWAMYFNYCKQECQTCTYETISTELYASQTILAGSVQITNDEEFLYVTYTTQDGWYLDYTHLYIGLLKDMPTTKTGVPVPGLFPYKTDHTGLVTSFTYSIPLSSLQNCYSIAAHANVFLIKDGNVVQTETAWGFGIQFPNSPRWGWYNDYCTQVCE